MAAASTATATVKATARAAGSDVWGISADGDPAPPVEACIWEAPSFPFKASEAGAEGAPGSTG